MAAVEEPASLRPDGADTESSERRAEDGVADDEQLLLVERCRHGDAEAFRLLFRKHRNDVVRLAHRMLGGATDLEDVVQEVFLQVHRSIRDFRGQARFTTWLYRVTVNVVLMHRRAARSRPVFVDAPDLQGPSDARPLPDEEVARRARIRAFERLLDQLSDKKRTVFVLHELEGLAPAEISKIVNAPVLTVRTRLFYARRELEDMIAQDPCLMHLRGVLQGDPEEDSSDISGMHKKVESPADLPKARERRSTR